MSFDTLYTVLSLDGIFPYGGIPQHLQNDMVFIVTKIQLVKSVLLEKSHLSYFH